MTDSERRARIAAALAKEQGRPLKWFYLSFAENGFLGAAIVRAEGHASAIRRTHQLGINPGGQVLTAELPLDVTIPSGHTDKLLSLEQLRAIFGDVERVQA